MSFELFRRIATDAITTPDLLTDRMTTSAGRGPVTTVYARLPGVTDATAVGRSPPTTSPA